MRRFQKPRRELGQYAFTGIATVSVTCYVEAESEEEARAMVEAGEVTWECEEVDGDVTEIEACGE